MVISSSAHRSEMGQQAENVVTMEDAGTINITRTIDDGRWTGYGKLVLAIASLAFIVDGLANQAMSVSVPAMMAEWHVARGAFSAVTAAGLAGMAVGAFAGGILADRIGRKVSLLLSILLFGLLTAAISQAQNVDQLLVMRALDGFGIGGALPAAAAMIAEFTPKIRKSRAVIIGMICISVGNLACGMVGAAILPTLGWHLMFLFNGILSLAVFLIIWLTLPESPRHLLKRPARRQELVKILNRLNIKATMETVLTVGAGTTQRSPLGNLFAPEALFTTIGLAGAFFFCFLAVYCGLNWIPTLMSSHGFEFRVTSLTLSFWSIGGLCGGPVVAKIVEFIGSKKALCLVAALGSVVAVGVSFLPITPSHSVLPVMLAFALEGLCFSGLTGGLYGLAAYAYPSSSKGTGVGFASAFGRLGAVASAFAAVQMIEIGGNAFFLLVAASGIVSVFFLLLVSKHIPKDSEFTAARAIVK